MLVVLSTVRPKYSLTYTNFRFFPATNMCVLWPHVVVICPDIWGLGLHYVHMSNTAFPLTQMIVTPNLSASRMNPSRTQETNFSSAGLRQPNLTKAKPQQRRSFSYFIRFTNPQSTNFQEVW